MRLFVQIGAGRKINEQTNAICYTPTRKSTLNHIKLFIYQGNDIMIYLRMYNL